MNKSNCEAIRRELDEILLSESCSAAALEHLSQCNDCQEFHRKQTRLRQIVGGLSTVTAPADFDFRLRSRLASESTDSSRYLNTFWLFSQRNAAVAMALIVLFSALVLLRQFTIRRTKPEHQAIQQVDKQKDIQFIRIEPEPEGAPASADVKLPHESISSSPSKSIVKREVQSNRQSMAVRKPMVAADFGFGAAPVIKREQSLADAEAIFPIDASQQSFKVSLYDGRGNARTISLPTVSFGSQRVLPSGSQPSSRGVW
jgi:hypothetical protein